MGEHIINFVEGEGISIQAAQSPDGEMWDVEIANTVGGQLEQKGDLLTAVDEDTPARLPAGSDGQILTADSTQATGIRWAAAPGGGLVAADPIWDAKGDLAVGTAADTAARLPSGSNGHVLTADSTAATGLKWAAAAGSLLWEDV